MTSPALRFAAAELMAAGALQAIGMRMKGDVEGA